MRSPQWENTGGELAQAEKPEWINAALTVARYDGKEGR
jgi:hypothetical protein